MENYIVAALTASLPKKEQCMVVKETDVIITTHSKVFGPDTKEACEKWMAENCGQTPNPPVETKYIVASLTESLPKNEDCILVKSGDFFPTTYTKVFGPESEDACRKWITENCGKSDSLKTKEEEKSEGKDPRYFWLYILQYGVITLVTLAFVLIFWLGLGKNSSVGDEVGARGMITFLVAVSTVAIAMLTILTAMLVRDFKERFAAAKEVLAILVGILGTIVGFYFGAASNPGANSNSNTNVNVNGNANGNGNNNGNNNGNGNSTPANKNATPANATPAPTASARRVRLSSGREILITYTTGKKRKIIIL